MRVHDYFVGGWGAAYGYHLAGASTVVGFDFVQRRDVPVGPFEFRNVDLREWFGSDEAVEDARRADLLHFSPPCKENTRLGHLRDAQGGTAIHADLLEVTREFAERTGVPYVIENVPGAAMRPDVTLCGSMFPELHVYDGTTRRWLQRHRLFELGGWGLMGIGLQPDCRHAAAGARPLGVWGTAGDRVPDGGECATVEQARALMGMPWASWASLTQAIPPAYTRYLGGAFAAELVAA